MRILDFQYPNLTIQHFMKLNFSNISCMSLKEIDMYKTNYIISFEINDNFAYEKIKNNF